MFPFVFPFSCYLISFFDVFFFNVISHVILNFDFHVTFFFQILRFYVAGGRVGKVFRLPKSS